MLYLVLISILFVSTTAEAEIYAFRTDEPVQLIGDISFARAKEKDTLIDIAQRFGVGHDEIVKANPSVNRWVPGEGTRIVLPTYHVLPDVKQEGLVLNLAELRLYYFHRNKSNELIVETYPVSTGRMDWRTPQGEARVVRKTINPAWYPPESIRREHAARGEPLPSVVPGGVPENPLGTRAMYLSLPSYLIHGTNRPQGLGLRVTHGCIRMYPKDIESLYSRVPVGTPVQIVHQPIKVGWQGNDLYLQIETPLDPEEQFDEELSFSDVMREIQRKARPGMEINEQAIRRELAIASGLPVPVAEVYGSLRERYYEEEFEF